MKIRYFLIYAWIFIIPLNIYAQDQPVDSLKAVIETLKDDSIKVNTLNELSYSFWDTNPDMSIMYAMEAMDMAYKVNFRKGVAYALKNMGMAYFAKSDYISVLEYWQQSLAVFDSIGDRVGVSNILNNIGSVYFDQSDNASAVDYDIRAAKVAEEIGNTLRMASVYINIGSIYSEDSETYENALEYFSLALRLSEELGEYDIMGTSSVNLGELYYKLENYDSALFYYERSLEAFEFDGSGTIPYSLNNIGKLYSTRAEYPSSIKFHEDAYDIAKENQDKKQMSQSLIGLGNTYRLTNDHRSALTNYQEAEQLAQEIGATDELQQAYEGLAFTYSQIRDFSNAFKYQNLLTDINYQLYNEANDKKIQRLQFGYEIDKREEEITQLTTEKALQDSEMKRQRIMIYAILGGLVLIMAIAVITYKNYREKARINKVLDKQNAEIESLILNILPKEIARELQAEGEATPRYYENVSVLFTDFKGFSSISKDMTPNELVEHLNAYFHAFDDIVGRFGLEKIKTIGDAYMCAGGIPLPNKTHPLDIVKAGLAMQEYINQRKEEMAEKGQTGWDLRVGIHTGPIVAGVVGKKKYAYDIWGNTVNIASRMESNGEPGKVNISDATYNLVKDQYKCLHRGKIYAKNVGDIDMYFIEEEIPVEKEIESIQA
jgi:class 3 adenylate cyclase